MFGRRGRVKLGRGDRAYGSKGGNAIFQHTRGGKVKIHRRTSKGGGWKLFKPKR
jgi:hypothetical protein